MSTDLPQWAKDYPEVIERCAVDSEFKAWVMEAEDNGYRAVLILDARSWKADKDQEQTTR